MTRTPVPTSVVGINAWERARRNGIEDDVETFQQRRYGVKIELLKRLRTAQTRGADHISVPSKYLRGLVGRWGIPESDKSVIYNALKIEMRSVPLSERADRIITIGRLVLWKGIDDIVDAFDHFGGEAELHTAGDCPEPASLERRAKETGRAEMIRFHGQIDHKQVLHLLAHNMVFVLNSTYEGLPHIVLEAMACGTPTVSCNDAYATMVENAGLGQQLVFYPEIQ